MTGTEPAVPETMRALRVRSWSDGLAGAPDLAVDRVAVPTLRAGETLVRIDAAALTHLDLTVATGGFAHVPDLPYTGGVEGVGTVLVSSSSTPGTRVVIKGGGVGLSRSGTWAEYVAVPDEVLTPVPHELPVELAASFLTPATTAHAALTTVARLGDWPRVGASRVQDEVVVVTGAAGAVGSLAVQLATAAGATVVGLVATADRAVAVPPCAEVVAADDADRVARLARERGATLLIDTVGGPELLPRSRWVRPGGRAVVIGYLAGTHVEVDLPHWLAANVALLPVSMLDAGALTRVWAPDLAGRLLTGDLTLATVAFPLAEAARAVARLRTGRSGRVVLLP